MVRYIRIIFPFLLIACMVFIFLLSAQEASQSSQTSSGFIQAFLKVFYPGFKKLLEIKQEALISSLQFFVRKSAHFTLYGILGICSFFSFITYSRIPLIWRIVLSLAVCLLYAITDEIHQLFVVGRSGEVRDVIIDFCGSGFFITIIYFIVKHNKFKGVFAYEKKGIV